MTSRPTPGGGVRQSGGEVVDIRSMCRIVGAAVTISRSWLPVVVLTCSACHGLVTRITSATGAALCVIRRRQPPPLRTAPAARRYVQLLIGHDDASRWPFDLVGDFASARLRLASVSRSVMTARDAGLVPGLEGRDDVGFPPGVRSAPAFRRACPRAQTSTTAQQRLYLQMYKISDLPAVGRV